MIVNLIYSIIPGLCICIGFYFGFRIGKEKEIPKIKTISEVIEEKKEIAEEKKEKNIMTDYLSNIDNYPNNQKEIKE